MANRSTPEERRRELYRAYHAVYEWFTNQPLPVDRWHEIDAASVDREVALRFVEALENATDAEPEWTDKLLHTEPFATLWSQTKYGRPDVRRYSQSLIGVFSVGNPASPLPERDWKGQFAKMPIPESVTKAAHPDADVTEHERQATQSSIDVFICHASEDKDAFVRPLAEALRAAGVSVWYDECSLSIGDRLRSSIDKGLGAARYGVVVLRGRKEITGHFETPSPTLVVWTLSRYKKNTRLSRQH